MMTPRPVAALVAAALVVFAFSLVMLPSAPAFAAGAIAVDDEEGQSAKETGYGVGEGATRAEAAKHALAECKKAGNKDCKVVVRYDTCGAYAASKKHSGIGFGKTKAIATKKALDECGISACRIVVADCVGE